MIAAKLRRVASKADRDGAQPVAATREPAADLVAESGVDRQVERVLFRNLECFNRLIGF